MFTPQDGADPMQSDPREAHPPRSSGRRVCLAQASGPTEHPKAWGAVVSCCRGAVMGLSWRTEDALSAARQSQGPATPSPTEDQPSFRVSRLCLHHRTENDSFPCFPASLSGKGAFGGWRVWPPPWWIPAAAGPLLVFSLHSCRAGGAWGYGSTRVGWAFHALVGSPAPSPGVGTKQALCP